MLEQPRHCEETHSGCPPSTRLVSGGLRDTAPVARIEDYLDHVFAPLLGLVPYARRQELRAELRGHLEALAASYRELGSAPDTASEQALRQFGDPRELARGCADEWQRRAPGRSPQPVWPAVLVAFGCFSLLQPLYQVLAATVEARGF